MRAERLLNDQAHTFTRAPSVWGASVWGGGVALAALMQALPGLAVKCRFLLVLLCLCLCPVFDTQARTLSARIARIQTPLAELHDVNIRLQWPQDADAGVLALNVGHLHAPTLGQRFERLQWQCPLRQRDGWQCEGPVRSGDGPPLQLAVDLSAAVTAVALSDGAARLHLHRAATMPDLTRIELTQVPLVWLQEWLASMWPPLRLGEGRLTGVVQVLAADAAPLQIDSAFTLADGALEIDTGEIAAAGVGLQAELALALDEHDTQVKLRGRLHGGEALFGNAYLELPKTPVTLELDAQQYGDAGWHLPHLHWRDGEVLDARGAIRFTQDAGFDHLHLHLRSDDLSAWPERYLSGWLGLAGLSGLTLSGGVDAQFVASAAGWERLDARLKEVHLHEANGRFALAGLNGHLRHVLTGQQDSTLSWQSGSLGGIAFGSAHWPLQSRDGLLQLTAPVTVETLNGQVSLQPLRLRLPHSGQALQLDFGLHLQQLDLAPLSTALGWPAFGGQLTGSIPAARYRDGWLDLDGGLSLAVFDGRIDVTALVMERPFGVAPSLSLDLSLMNLDLMAITEVFDFGSVSGRLDGQIAGLRLIDWSPTAFAAELHTVPQRGVRQRISQRAVQDISSVGGGGIMHTIQGRLIGFFKDFGYRRIGIGCRLLNEVCTMSGLHSARTGFMIVEGAGLPRLNVVGWGREVDWPTLVERLQHIADGATPVVQ